WFPVVVVFAAALARALRSDDPRRLNLAFELLRPSLQHPFGCGEGGVDLLALASEALLRSFAVASIVAVCSLLIGTGVGSAVGLEGGHLERAVRRACYFVQSFPSFVLALGILAAVPHPTRIHVGLMLALSAWAPFARLALAELRVVRGLAYVEAARALGAR